MAAAAPQPPVATVHHCPFPFTGPRVSWDGFIYTLMAQRDHFAFRTLADTIEGWTLRHDKNGVLTWDKKIKGEDMRQVKVFGIFPDTDPELLYDVLQDGVFRAEWDENRIDGFEVVRLCPAQDIGYYGARLPAPLDDREFVNTRGWHKTGSGEFQIFNTSVQTTRFRKESKGFVRAISKVTGYLIRPWVGRDGQRGCSLTYVAQSDPKGWIPSSLANSATTVIAPKTIEKLAGVVKRYPAWIASRGAAYKKTWVVPDTPYVNDAGAPITLVNKIYDFVGAAHPAPVAPPESEEPEGGATMGSPAAASAGTSVSSPPAPAVAPTPVA
jgi:hypothetical protein